MIDRNNRIINTNSPFFLFAFNSVEEKNVNIGTSLNMAQTEFGFYNNVYLIKDFEGTENLVGIDLEFTAVRTSFVSFKNEEIAFDVKLIPLDTEVIPRG